MRRLRMTMNEAQSAKEYCLSACRLRILDVARPIASRRFVLIVTRHLQRDDKAGVEEQRHADEVTGS